ncbi:MAG TPA: YetF domain-containing protein [Xanthomonadaceae bacterium]|nr:YetF domain-containing protein [Xanthomonadaceae bacterium]
MPTDITLFDWQRLLVGLPPKFYYFEIAFKTLALFAILLLVLRLLGKRAHHNLSPMQQMLLIALGSAAGDVMLYPEVPLGYAAFILLGVTGLVMLLEVAGTRSRMVRDYVESRPRVLVRDGQVDWDALHRERTTPRELFAELRTKGARSLAQVEAAILEVSGDISVFLHKDKDTGGNDDLLRYVLEDDHDLAPVPGNRE